MCTEGKCAKRRIAHNPQSSKAPKAMIHWIFTLSLIIIAFVMPFFLLRRQVQALQSKSMNNSAEIDLLRLYSKQLEQRVQNDQEDFLNSLGVPFMLIRPSGRLVLTNREAIELLGIKENTNLLRTLPKSPLRHFIGQATLSDSPVKQRLKLQHAGEERIFHISSSPLHNSEHHIGIVCLDITEEHRTMVIRREFIANASHELRTPMTIIRGYLENLLEDPETAANEAMRSRALRLMKKHSDRIERLVEDMLTISKLEGNDKAYLRIKEFDLAVVIDDLHYRLEHTLQQQEVKLSIDIQPSPFPMEGDRFYWEQILFNLIENALKNNPSPGLRLEIKAEIYQENFACIRIIDDGRGICAEKLPYIFNRFYRGDSTGKVKGTGLGLSIVKNALEAHGGKISATSIPKQKTCFSIIAPLIAPQA